jgi:hypothetical protein
MIQIDLFIAWLVMISWRFPNAEGITVTKPFLVAFVLNGSLKPGQINEIEPTLVLPADTNSRV